MYTVLSLTSKLNLIINIGKIGNPIKLQKKNNVNKNTAQLVFTLDMKCGTDLCKVMFVKKSNNNGKMYK